MDSDNGFTPEQQARRAQIYQQLQMAEDELKDISIERQAYEKREKELIRTVNGMREVSKLFTAWFRCDSLLGLGPDQYGH